MKKYHVLMECMHSDGTSHYESRFVHAGNHEEAVDIVFDICKFLGFTSIGEICVNQGHEIKW